MSHTNEDFGIIDNVGAASIDAQLRTFCPSSGGKWLVRLVQP